MCLFYCARLVASRVVGSNLVSDVGLSVLWSYYGVTWIRQTAAREIGERLQSGYLDRSRTYEMAERCMQAWNNNIGFQKFVCSQQSDANEIQLDMLYGMIALYNAWVALPRHQPNK
jgi:hypothetical protein